MRALSPVEPATQAYPLKSTKIKRKLGFGKDAEGQRKSKATNILNLPYLDSDPEPSPTEMEDPKKEIPKTSSEKKVSKKPKVQKLEKELAELNLLERHLKTENKTLRKSSLKVGFALDKLAIKYETLKNKNKKLFKQNNILQNVNKVLRFNLAHKRTKPKAQINLDDLAEAALVLQ